VAHTIRKASPNDTEVLSQIVRTAHRDVAVRFQLTAENAPTHPSNCQPGWIASGLSRGVSYFILFADADPCGCVALERAAPELAYLERLAVIPERRGRGFGSALVVHGLIEAAAAGAREVSVGVIADHTEIVEWYQKRGFSFVEKRQFPHLPFTVAFLRRGVVPCGK
jgi:N-acetylglutamate synthase-like GNAT family acetyltransferase